MQQDDYELLPHAELEHLRREVDRLKRNPLGDTQASISLLEGMNSLNENIQRLVQIFQSASDDMSRLARSQSVAEQLQRLRSENAKIAHGIVALSEMMKDAPMARQIPEPVPDEPPTQDFAPMPPPTEHDDVVQQLDEQPNPFMNEPAPPPPDAAPDQKDQFTGEPLPPPPRR